VTGATGGLGYETALALAKAGAEVILTGRDDRKGQSAIEKIGREVSGARVSYEPLDLANHASIADFSQRMHSRKSLDLLINNAGVMALPRRQTTSDGFEMQFGTNYLGHFVLTARLIPLLRRASEPRVVNVSSLARRTAFIDFDDLQGARAYSPWKAYGQSKLAMLMFALQLQRRSDATGWNLTSNAAHPGFARTGLFASGPGGLLSLASDFAAPFFGQSATDGARPILFAAASPEAMPGAYYGPGAIGELRGAPAPALIMPQARDGQGQRNFGAFQRNSQRRLSVDGRQMQLAKNVIDLGLSTNNLEAMLRFWQQGAGLRFDHVLPVRRGQKQYRHDALGSVIKLNHHAEPLPAAAPSGYRELIVAREGVEKPRSMVDPDGNRVRLVPPAHDGITQLAIRMGVRSLSEHRRFYGDIFGFAEQPWSGGLAFRLGDSLLLLEEDRAATVDPARQALGWRYITLQIADIDAVHKDLRSKGVREGLAPVTLGSVARISIFLDPDGNWIELSRRASIVGSLS
jgi:NAD(P)-dependent dehydrogenase (short-subunit alcohol dehydrogenase family)/catechol 2,3-dioxygenase-like lactoylglutathione lyase family enzyme